ncbi:MAG: hypothetical protein ABIE07_01290 [Candidatus Zixiibacteriota bacterium]
MNCENAEVHSSIERLSTTREIIAFHWRQDWFREFVLAAILALMVFAMIVSVTIVIHRPEASSIKNDIKRNSTVSLANTDMRYTMTIG